MAVELKASRYIAAYMHAVTRSFALALDDMQLQISGLLIWSRVQQ